MNDDWVSIPIKNLLDKEETLELSDKWFKIQKQLIDELRNIVEKRKTLEQIGYTENLSEERRKKAAQKELNKIEENSTLPSIDDVKEETIKRRIKKLRPDTKWSDIAKSLGISKKTLYVRRKEYGLIDDVEEGNDKSNQESKNKHR